MIKVLSILKIYCPSFQLMASIIAFVVFLSSTGHTKNIVSGKYLSISENVIQFVVEVDTPAPTNLIVQHKNSAQIRLVNTIPNASKVDNAKGIAKWFLKSIEPGTISFSLSFNSAVSKKAVQVSLMYRDPASGNFIETVVLP